GEELHAVFRRLDAKLDAEGDCWGDDATGKAFLTTYGPAAQDTVTAGHHVASAIQDVARRLTRAADRAEASDVRTRRRFS
ncbi:MAG TPA: hypothetical protein VEK80_11825, partial [Kribbellaceae bacterium]|nr:hypothetical protein [Kribbellaceae bacterium]